MTLTDCIAAPDVLKNVGSSSGGYYCFKRRGPLSLKNKIAHRHVWEECFGPIPGSLFVLHRCDNRPCVNPEHLFLGTQADNLRDMVQKGRSCRGERHWNAKLTEAEARSIRATPKTSGSTLRLMQQFNVSKTTITRIRAGKLWRHIL